MEELKQIKLDDIVPSSDNARKIDQKSRDFEELVNSIRAGGVRVPIHVRPHPKRAGKFEIRAGERRWRASKAAGEETIRAVVHTGIKEIDALDLTYIENKFRLDLKPLEEVAEIGRALQRTSDVKSIAEKIGQTEQWVRLRANIHKSLTQGWRYAFEKQSPVGEWTVGHLILIARLPARVQKELLSDVKNQYWQWRNVSVRDLKDRIGRTLNLLSRAGWPLDDETLVPKAGACSKCPKRSGAQPLLWYETVTDQVKANDRCLDGGCWAKKQREYVQRKAKKLAGENPDMIYVSTESADRETGEYLAKKYGRVLDTHNYKKSGRKAKGAVPALVVHGKSAGGLVWVRENKIAGPAARKAGKPTPLKQRRAKLKAKRWAQVLLELREKLEKTGVGSIRYEDRITGVMAIAAFYGNVLIFEHAREDQAEILKLVKNKDSAKALEYLWESVRPTLDNLLAYNGPVTQTSESYIEEARWIADLIKADLKAMFKEVSQQKGFTEPKSWKGLNEDGTTKKKN